jgi:rare lipoprotein A
VRRVIWTASFVFLLSLASSQVESQERDDIASVAPARVRSKRPPPASNLSCAFAPPAAKGKRRASPGAVGLATYYARSLDGRITASGVRFDTDAMVAAHPTYSFGTVVRVTNLRNGRSAKVRIVDRGPAPGPRRNGVIVDVSRAAAECLGFIRAGRARVRLDVLSLG